MIHPERYLTLTLDNKNIILLVFIPYVRTIAIYSRMYREQFAIIDIVWRVWWQKWSTLVNRLVLLLKLI